MAHNSGARHAKPGGNKKLAPWLMTTLILILIIIVVSISFIYFWHSREEKIAQDSSSSASSTEAYSRSVIDSLSSIEATTTVNMSIRPQATLVLLDASASMDDIVDGRSLFNISRDAIMDAATQANQPVSLWNYSSPLSPGVTRGWRHNTDFLAPEQIRSTLYQLGTGGVPQTREAILAALPIAAQYHEAVNIVLITSGTADATDDTAFSEQVRALLKPEDNLNVVHVGGRETDTRLSSLATVTYNARTSQEIFSGVSRAFGLSV